MQFRLNFWVSDFHTNSPLFFEYVDRMNFRGLLFARLAWTIVWFIDWRGRIIRSEWIGWLRCSKRFNFVVWFLCARIKFKKTIVKAGLGAVLE